MSKSNKHTNEGSGKEKCFTVTWEERVIIGAQIWAISPEDAIKIAQNRSSDNLVNPSGCFSTQIPDSYDCIEEVEGATKDEYTPGCQRYIAIYL